MNRSRRPQTSYAVLPLLVLTLLLVMPAAPALQLTSWGGEPGQMPNKDVVPPDLAVAIRQGSTLTTWPAWLADLSTAGAPEWWRDRCLNISERNKATCRYGAAGPPSVALLGDSTAVSWMPGLRRAAAREGWQLQVLTRQGCPNAAIPAGQTVAVSVSCAAHQSWAVSEVLRLRPAVVVLSNRYGAATRAQWLTGLSATLARLAPAGARTVLLPPPPDTGSISQCLELRLRPSQCARRIPASFHALFDAERTASARHDVRFVDTRWWFCRDGVCPAVVSGLPVHFDGQHLTAVYAQRLRPNLEDAIER